MCLLAFAYQRHPDFPLLLAANRDEFLARPTAAMHYWQAHPQLLAGRDEQAGGTWMGIMARGPNTGRFAALTNVRQLPAPEKNGPSRGQVVLRALLERAPVAKVLTDIKQEADGYHGFNLLVGDATGLWYMSTHTPDVRKLTPGLYALSNATLDIAWPKTQSATQRMQEHLSDAGDVRDLAQLLSSRQKAEDDQLPKTGLSLPWERALSAQCIDLPEYATRAQTGLLVRADGTAEVHEQTLVHEPGSAPLPGKTFRLHGFW